MYLSALSDQHMTDKTNTEAIAILEYLCLQPSHTILISIQTKYGTTSLI